MKTNKQAGEEEETGRLSVKVKALVGVALAASACLSLWALRHIVGWVGEIFTMVAGAISGASVYVPVVACVIIMAVVASRIGH